MRQIRIGEYDSLSNIDGQFGSLKDKLKKVVRKVTKPVKKVVKKAATLHRSIAAKLAPKPLKKLIAPKKRVSSSSAPQQVVEETVYTDENGNTITQAEYERLMQEYQQQQATNQQYVPSYDSGGSYEADAPPASYYDSYDAEQPYGQEAYPEVLPESGGEEEYDEADETVTPIKQLTQDPATPPSATAPSGGLKLNPYVIAGGVAILGAAAYFLFLRKKN